jgi:hypothetical protein
VRLGPTPGVAPALRFATHSSLPPLFDREIREFGEEDLLPDLPDLPVDDGALMLN